jgi:hypothetical protein
MESWRKVWRDGFAPGVSVPGLEAIRRALAEDDPRLLQGATTTPPPMMSVQDWPVEAADLIGLAGWLGDGLGTVGEVEEYFAKACYDADVRLQEPAACRYFLDFWDDTPRHVARRELLAEVELALAGQAERRQT